MTVWINGERGYLCFAVDYEGDVLKRCVTKTRGSQTAMNFSDEQCEDMAASIRS